MWGGCRAVQCRVACRARCVKARWSPLRHLALHERGGHRQQATVNFFWSLCITPKPAGSISILTVNSSAGACDRDIVDAACCLCVAHNPPACLQTLNLTHTQVEVTGIEELSDGWIDLKLRAHSGHGALRQACPNNTSVVLTLARPPPRGAAEWAATQVCVCGWVCLRGVCGAHACQAAAAGGSGVGGDAGAAGRGGAGQAGAGYRLHMLQNCVGVAQLVAWDCGAGLCKPGMLSRPRLANPAS